MNMNHPHLKIGCLLAALFFAAMQLQADEKPSGFLGISVSEASDALRAQLDLRANEGVVIAWVQPGSPADKSGLKQYDVLLELNGKPISAENDLAKIVGNASAGDKANAWIVRKAKHDAIEITYGDRPMKVATKKNKKKPKTPLMIMPTIDAAVIGLNFPMNGHGHASSFMIHDGKYITQARKTDKGGLRITVRDVTGKTIYSGPADTKAERQKLPVSVRENLETKHLLP